MVRRNLVWGENMAIKNIKYKVKNSSNDYDTIYFETSAEQVITSDMAQFVSQNEKDNWNNKAENVHSHSLATDSSDGFMSATDKAKLDKMPEEPIEQVSVVDNLSSTEVNAALSANQGKILATNMAMFANLLESFNPIMFNVSVLVEGLDNADGVIVTATPAAKTSATVTATLQNGINFAILVLEPGVNYTISLSQKEGYNSSTVSIAGGTGQMAIRKLTYTKPLIYGFEIDQLKSYKNWEDGGYSNSPMEHEVTYTDSAIGMRPITVSKGVVDLGDWADTDLIKGNRPCVVKNGIVQYYLNPNDYSKKEDGTPANLDGTDGDAMAEFDKMYYKIEHDTDNKEDPWSRTRDIFKFKISSTKIDDSWKCLAFMDSQGQVENDKMYISIYNTHIDSNNHLVSTSDAEITSYTPAKAREAATSKGYNYQQLTAIKWNYLQMITTLVTKSVNITKIFGTNVFDWSETHISGKGNSLGQFHASSDVKRGNPTKLFHIEDLYAEPTIVEGMGNYKTKAFAPYSDTDFSEYALGGLTTGGIGNAQITPMTLTVHDSMGVVYPERFISDYSIASEGTSLYCGSGWTMGDSYEGSESYAAVGGGGSPSEGYNLQGINLYSISQSAIRLGEEDWGSKTRLTC